MEKFLKYGEKKGCSFVELKTHKGNRTSIELQNDEIKELSSGDSIMYSARVVYKGREGMSYSNKEGFDKLIDNAVRLARSMDKEINLQPLPKLKKRIKTKFKINPLDVDLEEKKKKILKLDLRRNFKKVNSIRFVYQDSSRTLNIINSEDRDLEWKDVSLGFIAFAHAKEGNRIEQFHDLRRGHYGFELFNQAEAAVKESMQMAQKMLESKDAKGGNYPVIIDSRLGGVFSHEAVGHACEADAVLQGASVMNNKLGKLVGSTSVHILDDGSREGCNGWGAFDDEEGEGHNTYLAKQGILEGYFKTKAKSRLK